MRFSAAILKAIAEKLIPGIPIQTRISILQQTSNDGSEDGGDVTSSLQNIKLSGNTLSVLEAVIDKATSRSEIQREIDSKNPFIIRGPSLPLPSSFKSD